MKAITVYCGVSTHEQGELFVDKQNQNKNLAVELPHQNLTDVDGYK